TSPWPAGMSAPARQPAPRSNRSGSAGLPISWMGRTASAHLIAEVCAFTAPAAARYFTFRWCSIFARRAKMEHLYDRSISTNSNRPINRPPTTSGQFQRYATCCRQRYTTGPEKGQPVSRNTSPEVELLLACARVADERATADEVRALLRSDLDWAYLGQIAAQHRQIPSLYIRLN